MVGGAAAMTAARLSLWPVVLALPDGTRRRGAIKAADWAAALVIAEREFPGAEVTAPPAPR
jgi:hypothetical protein